MSTELLDGVQSILESGKTAVEIDLNNEGLRDSDILKLVELFKKYSGTEISYLKLYRNDIGNGGANALATLSNVISINLCDNRVGDEGAKSLIANPKILKLNLTDNPVTDNCATFISENTNQIYLALERTKISDKNLSKIRERIEQNEKQNVKLHKKSPQITAEMVAVGIFKSPTVDSPKRTSQDKELSSSKETSSEDISPRVDIVDQHEVEGKTTVKLEVTLAGKVTMKEAEDAIRSLLKEGIPLSNRNSGHVNSK